MAETLDILSEASIRATREHFVDLAYACIREVIDGTVKVNQPEEYFEHCEQRALGIAAGRWDHTLTFRQYATWIQTGQMHALLPN